MLVVKGTKSNSINEASFVPTPTSAVKSASPGHPAPEVKPGLELGPAAESALPEERTIPSAKGNVPPFELK